MKKSFLSSKIHKATVTDSQLDYEGSCEIDISLLNAAGISVHEKIDIYNITNGERFTTYAIKGKAETGNICINGACCHKVSIGDKIIICTYVDIDCKEIKNHKPKVIHVDDENKILDSNTYGNVSLME